MDLSILITSFQRSHLLKWQFKSFLKQKVSCEWEILVLNDGIEDLTERICEQYSNRLPIKYVFTGQRNKNEIKWRVPGYVINIGAKLAQGKNIIISCAEMFLLDDIISTYVNILNKDSKTIVITEGKDDRKEKFTRALNSNYNNLESIYNSSEMNKLDTIFPFFLGINKEEFLSIGGYDEDMIGYCWDDKDFVDRLIWNECHYQKIKGRVVHLYHPRVLRPGIGEKNKLWIYNRKIYEERINIVKRNQDRDWGILNDT